MSVIKLENVEKSFGNVKAVDDLSFTVKKGEITGFLGANGAGKTTTIKMLLGFIRPDAGRVLVSGADPLLSSTRKNIGYMPETAWYYPWLKVYELLNFYGGLCGMSRKETVLRSRELIERVGLKGADNRLLKTFSKGMLQRVGIAQALLHDPAVYILDEPFTGLDPLARIQFRDLLGELKEKGKTILFSSHELSEAELICDNVVIMKKGQAVWSGSRTQVAGDGTQNLERVFLDIIGDDDKQKETAV
ncbi:MAG: ABC transporter ATP-binding protein [Kiritimatiellia bacterium]